jgi:hypothetical protein
MDKQDYPKAIECKIRELAGLAYEEELRQALIPLAISFDEWRAGKISSDELSTRIHQFHEGPAHEIFVRYCGPHPRSSVAYAIVNGFVDRGMIPEDVREALKGAVQFYEEEK